MHILRFVCDLLRNTVEERIFDAISINKKKTSSHFCFFITFSLELGINVLIHLDHTMKGTNLTISYYKIVVLLSFLPTVVFGQARIAHAYTLQN